MQSTQASEVLGKFCVIHMVVLYYCILVHMYVSVLYLSAAFQARPANEGVRVSLHEPNLYPDLVKRK